MPFAAAVVCVKKFLCQFLGANVSSEQISRDSGNVSGERSQNPGPGKTTIGVLGKSFSTSRIPVVKQRCPKRLLPRVVS